MNCSSNTERSGRAEHTALFKLCLSSLEVSYAVLASLGRGLLKASHLMLRIHPWTRSG